LVPQVFGIDEHSRNALVRGRYAKRSGNTGGGGSHRFSNQVCIRRGCMSQQKHYVGREVNSDFDPTLIFVSLGVIVALIVGLAIAPEAGTHIADVIFGFMTDTFGSAVLLFTFGCVVFLTIIALSRYGEIRLGDGPPDFTTKSWIAMMLTAGLGSATVYWAFIEWAFYYNTPGLGIEPHSDAAYAWSLAYNFFHWGISAWSLYCMAVLPIAYHVYVRKNEGMSLSALVARIVGIRSTGVIGKLVDIIFIFTCIGGLSITLGLSVPLLSQGIARVIGIESSFTLNLVLVALISVAFTLSAYLGIEKGVRRVTNLNSIFAIVFIGLILIIGPTLFMIDNTINALGLMFQNFIHMSLWTSPVADDSFPKSWTMFYWLYWITYTPFMGIFVARISKGRRIKEVIMNMLITGSVGCWVFFGVLENFSMNANMQQLVDVAGNLSDDGGNAAILNVMGLLPGPGLFILFFVVVSMLFLVSTLDSASYTLAATATRRLSNHQDPSPGHRVFWCVMVTVMPLMMIFIDAPLDTIKTAAIVTAIPLLIVLMIMNVGMVRWMREDYGRVSRDSIRNADAR